MSIDEKMDGEEPPFDQEFGSLKRIFRDTRDFLRSGRLKEEPPRWSKLTWAYAGVAAYCAARMLIPDMPIGGDDLAAAFFLPVDVSSLALPSQHAAAYNLLWLTGILGFGGLAIGSYMARRDWPDEGVEQ